MSDVKIADLTAPIVFDDLEPVKVPVRIKGRAYWLVEAMADAAVKYRNALSTGGSFDPETKRVMTGAVADAEPLVVAHCLYAAANVTEANPDGELPLDKRGNLDPVFRVKLPTLLGWRIDVQQTLFARLVAISPGLTRGDAAPSGNGKPAADASSGLNGVAEDAEDDAGPKGGPRSTAATTP